MKKTYILIGFILLATLVWAQSIPSFPPTFSYNLPSLPPILSANQLWLSNCPYKMPIELKDVEVYSVSGTQLAPKVTAQIRVWVNGRKTVCSYKQTFSVQPAVTSGALVTNFITALDQNIIATANLNTQPITPPNPISHNS